MKNLIFLIAGLSALMVLPASARVGGPFDGNTFSRSLEQGGTYQAVLSFRNGNGFLYFTPDNDIAPTQSNSANATGGGVAINTQYITSSALSLRNRSIIYYKGFVFAGMATGIVDTESGFVTATSNGSSEYGSTITSATANPSAAGTSVPVVQNSGTAYIANSNFVAKIITEVPSVTFRGRGEIAFISPNGYANSLTQVQALFNTLNTLVTQPITQGNTAATNFITASTPSLSTAVAGPAVVTTNTVGGVLVTTQTQAATTAPNPAALTAMLAGLSQIQDATNAAALNSSAAAAAAVTNALKPPSLADAEKDTERLPMRVTGNLRYF